MNESSIPAELQELVNAKLMDNETIRWMDMSVPYFFSLGSSIAFGFGIYATVIAVFILTIGITGSYIPEHDRIGFYLMPIPCLLFGLWLLSFPLLTRQKSKRTVYAVTNLRAIVVDGTFSAYNVASYYPTDLWQLSCKQKANGLGSLCFRIDSGGFLPWMIRRGFWNIHNVSKVERILQELKGTK